MRYSDSGARKTRPLACSRYHQICFHYLTRMIKTAHHCHRTIENSITRIHVLIFHTDTAKQNGALPCPPNILFSNCSTSLMRQLHKQRAAYSKHTLKHNVDKLHLTCVESSFINVYIPPLSLHFIVRCYVRLPSFSILFN